MTLLDQLGWYRLSSICDSLDTETGKGAVYAKIFELICCKHLRLDVLLTRGAIASTIQKPHAQD